VLPGSPERHHVRHDLHGLPIDPDVEPNVAGSGADDQESPSWRPTLPALAAVFGGGIAGGLARYGIEYAVAAPSDRFPWDSFVVNLAGAFGLAVLLVLAAELAPGLRQLRPALATGFFGAFTTFSSLAIGVDRLVGHNELAVALTYGAGSMVGGLAAASLGFVTGRAVVANRRNPAQAARLSSELTGSGRR
jgi:CrcB protein